MHFASCFVMYGLFHDVVTSTDCLQKLQWLNLRHYVSTCFEELRENTIFSH